MKIRPALWRLSTVISVVMLIGLCGVLAVVFFKSGAPGDAVMVLPWPVLVFGFALLRTLRVQLEITESMVHAMNGGWRDQPDKQVPRSEIRSIHRSSSLISFWGPDNTPIMRVEPAWTMRQMQRVAAELKVPLYDHRRWFGMREDRKGMGRRVYGAASTPEDAGHAKTDTDDQDRSVGSGSRIILPRNPVLSAYSLLIVLLVAGALLGAYTFRDDLNGEIGYWDAIHAVAIVFAGIPFLRVYHLSEGNTWTYGPGRAPHLRWQGWLIPVANLYMPGQLRDTLIASSVPTSLEKPDSSAAQLTPFQHWTYRTFLASWIGLQTAGALFIAAFWIAHARHGEIPFTLLIFDAMLQVFSITGAASLIVLVTRITWLQRKRNKEAYYLPPRGKWWLAPDPQTSDGWTLVEKYRPINMGCLGWIYNAIKWGVVLFVGMLALLVAAGPLSDVTPLPLPPLQLSRQALVGTWHGADNATLTLRANGTFVARDIPEDLRYGTDDFHPWSGSGWWTLSKNCAVATPGICVTVDERNATTLDSVGSSVSPLLRFPDLGDPGADDLHK
jgi:hypothetical protein